MSRQLNIQVPPGVKVPPRHPDAPASGKLLGSHNLDCYGCGPDHPAGLHLVAYAGEKYGVKPANFLDIGGGASADVMANGLSIILGDSDVKSVFVNVFGGITSCDAVATGIVQALEILGDKATKPIVVRLDGNNVEAGRKILNDANHPLVQQLETMDGAAAKAAELAGK